MSINKIAITTRSVELTLSGCSNGSVGAVTYIVRYVHHPREGNWLSVETNTSQLNVTDLRSGKQYAFEVQCKNSVGMTGPSVTRNATTLSEGLFVGAFVCK